jgi:flagellar hook-associated protein 3 FlgL
MSTIRTSLASMGQNTIYQLETSMSRLQDLQNQMSSGKAINRPSDNPGGTVQAMSYQADIDRSTQYSKNVVDGQGWLGQADSVLSDVQAQLQKVQTLTIQAANGTTDASGRAAIADQIDGIRQGLLADGNTSYLGQPLFGGTSGATNAYDPTTGQWNGNTQAISRSVAPGVKVQVNMAGTDIFGPPGNDVFAALANISQDLRTNNQAALTTHSQALQGLTANVSDAQAVVGSRENQLQSSASALATKQGTLQTNLASVINVDFAKAVTDFQLQQTTYQAALKATAMIIQPSLASFLS